MSPVEGRASIRARTSAAETGTDDSTISDLENIFIRGLPPTPPRRRIVWFSTMVLLRPAARGWSWRSLSVAAARTEGPGGGVPYAPGKFPVFGHALTIGFDGTQFCNFLEKTARDMDAWSFKLEFPIRTATVVGDPAMAQAVLKTTSGWGSRGIATVPFMLDSTEAIVGDPDAAGIVFANGPVHHAPARKAAAAGLLAKSFVVESEAAIVAKTNELKATLAAADGAPVDVQVQYARCALDVVGALAWEIGVRRRLDREVERVGSTRKSAGSARRRRSSSPASSSSSQRPPIASI